MPRLRRPLAALAALTAPAALGVAPASATIVPPTPIQHVVFIYQENHSFDETLGQLCLQDNRCESVAFGKLPNGQSIPLHAAPDVVPEVNHGTASQKKAINGGKMNGWANIPGCQATRGYACYQQYQPGQIPNLAALARQFALSDATFQMDTVPSWGAHVELVAQTLDGFLGAHGNVGIRGKLGWGWGCDSGYDAPWRENPGSTIKNVPACVPDPSLPVLQYPNGGAYRPTPVQYVPTIMDRLDDVGLSWRMYSTKKKGTTPYGWAICPDFAECLYTDQAQNQAPSEQVISDGQAGLLPAFSVVLPNSNTSQHNSYSMIKGDNWIGDVVGAIESGPDWATTAIFITYDDCGCFYDHVNPPPKLGIRVPMVIVSPYAKPGFTDSTNTSFSAMLAFTEHVFGLEPLTSRDATAYDYQKSFDFTTVEPTLAVPLENRQVPRSSKRYIRRHPPDPYDPT